MNGVEPYVLAAGGMVGAMVQAFLVQHQNNLSRETGLDLFVGTIGGLLWRVPLFGIWPPFELAPQASLIQRAAIVALVMAVGLRVLKSILFRTAPAVLERVWGAKLPAPEPKP